MSKLLVIEDDPDHPDILVQMMELNSYQTGLPMLINEKSIQENALAQPGENIILVQPPQAG
jgi:hypothetical protein